MTGDHPEIQQACTLAMAGTGNFAANLAALVGSFGLETVLFVDEFRREDYLDRPVCRAAELTGDQIAAVDKWLVAISHPEHRRAAVKRLQDQGVPAGRILALHDDPDLQILRLLLEQFGPVAREAFCATGLTTINQLEDRFLAGGRERVLAGLDPGRSTVGLGYFGRGGGFRRHISALVPLLENRFNVVTMSDEVLDHAGEARRHLYLGAETACSLDCLDLVLSAHVFPCAPPQVPRVSFAHVIHDFNLTAEYHAARLAWSDTHYLFASSRPCFDWYVDLVRRHGLRNRICVIPGGYLQLDRTRAEIAAHSGPCDSILYAPTLALADYQDRELVSSLEQAPRILAALLAGFPEREVIFRPHPADLPAVRGSVGAVRASMAGSYLAFTGVGAALGACAGAAASVALTTWAGLDLDAMVLEALAASGLDAGGVAVSAGAVACAAAGVVLGAVVGCAARAATAKNALKDKLRRIVDSKVRQVLSSGTSGAGAERVRSVQEQLRENLGNRRAEFKGYIEAAFEKNVADLSSEIAAVAEEAERLQKELEAVIARLEPKVGALAALGQKAQQVAEANAPAAVV